MSDFNQIQTLLEKFWEGETSLEEERQLKSYFASSHVDQRLRQFAPMFQAFREEQTVQLNKTKVVPIRPQMYWAAAASIALLLTAGAWWLFSGPNETTIVADNQPKTEQHQNTQKQTIEPQKQVVAQIAPEHIKRTSHPKRLFAKQETSPVINAEEEAAMAEIKAALALVSSKIRKGRQEAAKGASYLESVDRIFKKKEG